MDQQHHKFVWTKGHIMIFWKTTLKRSLSKTRGSCERIDYESKHIMVDVAVEIAVQKFDIPWEECHWLSHRCGTQMNRMPSVFSKDSSL